MKYIAVIAAALAMGVPSANAGQNRNTVCAYQLPGGFIVVGHGRDNNLAYCRIISTQGHRIYNFAYPTYCTWKLRGTDVRVSIRAKSRYLGYVACEIWDEVVTPDWVKVR